LGKGVASQAIADTKQNAPLDAYQAGGKVMNHAGLIVAGGAGERMARSGGTLPKPLIPIQGVTLLERNLCALLRAGILDLHVAVAANSESLLRVARSRCRKIAGILGANLGVIVEDIPLGSIGSAAFLQDRDAVIVVNADNLTSLDLRAVLAAHEERDAALTLAIHDFSITIPFGLVALEGDHVVAYREKPTLSMPICSAVSVLGKSALTSIQRGENIGLPALANRLLSGGANVRGFYHTALWVDVNDMAAVKRAEALVATHPDEFLLLPSPYHRRMLEEILSTAP
jgi:NDP-sugar pyrophosphorylase family protein